VLANLLVRDRLRLAQQRVDAVRERLAILPLHGFAKLRIHCDLAQYA
jgi:hypothetical protein